MVRRHGSQSSVSFQSILGLLDVPMPFKQPTACEESEGDVPHTLVNRLAPDVLAGTADGDVHLLAIPPHPPLALT
jgi:hypothetical protein